MGFRTLAVLGKGIVPVDAPMIRADDAGLLRGDGAFETIHVRNGDPWLLNEHLQRMARSARLLDIRIPSADDLKDLVRTLLDGSTGDLSDCGVKLVCTRGPENSDEPTVFAALVDVTPAQRQGRREGVDLVVLTTGMSADVRSDTETPWLLGGAKTLSYAMNMAMLRVAAARCADDVLMVSADGIVLEAPTAGIAWAKDGVLYSAPTDTGILESTTVTYLLNHASDIGMRADQQRITVEEFIHVDEAWFCSSVRGAARIRSVDNKALKEAGLTKAVQDLLGFPVGP
jgi:4-amino-4-deoxychorismate lyase